MNDMIASPAPVWLRAVALLALLWNLFGVYAYLQTVGALPGGDPTMSAGTMPTWVTGAFAISVFSGALGSLGLLLLKRWAKLLLLLSLLCLLAQDLWAFVLSEGRPDKDPILPIVINLVAILLVWLAYTADRRGWLS